MGSVALNIFLVAFVFGRLSAMPPMPPFMDEPGRGGMKMFGHDAPPPPPPFFKPEMIFSPEEMDKNFAVMDENFKKVEALRKSFAARLQESPVSADEAKQHFVEVDAIMESVRKEMTEKAAEKISKMTDEERKSFAAHICDTPKMERMEPHP